ncbi:MAG TPA: hypothetical protein PLV92_27970, partial [Pirellulaceae bacterium]|nr:hypothetical protein [Pirellulaceae bacterium]
MKYLAQFSSFSRLASGLVGGALSMLLFVVSSNADDSERLPKRIVSRWAKDVDPARPLPEYPRPQLSRPDWVSLNGRWDFAIRPREDQAVEKFDEQIVVPFPVESTLSGVSRLVGPEKRAWYRRTFRVPAEWRDRRLLLHFGAVDWEAVVWVNGRQLTTHRGGYDPFSLDVTEALRLDPTSGKVADVDQEVVVAVWDPTDAGPQPRGKQVRKPEGIWYTPVTGIWQTVWLEPVGSRAIQSLRIEPRADLKSVAVTALLRDKTTEELKVRVVVPELKIDVEGAAWRPIELNTSAGSPWTPDSPRLYPMTIELSGNGQVFDRVESYFALRSVAIGSDMNGVPRMLLNG